MRQSIDPTDWFSVNSRVYRCPEAAGPAYAFSGPAIARLLRSDLSEYSGINPPPILSDDGPCDERGTAWTARTRGMRRHRV